MRRLALGRACPVAQHPPASVWRGRPGQEESPRLSSGRSGYLQRKGVEYLLSGKRVGVRREQERETPVSGLEASEGRALWKNLRHHTRSQSLGSKVCPAGFRHSPFQLPETVCPHRHSLLEEKTDRGCTHDPRPPHSTCPLAHTLARGKQARLGT